MPVSRAPGGVFRKILQVRFADVDFARVLYFPRHFHFLHLVMEDFFREVLDIPYSVVLKEDHVGFPTVRVEADFMAPLEFGDEVEVAMKVKELGRSRVVFGYEVLKAGQVAARCVQTVATIDATAWKPIDLPPKYRAGLEAVRGMPAE